MRKEKTTKEMTSLFITALVLTIICLFFGWVLSEKWPLLTPEERMSFLYVAIGSGALSVICWIVFIIML